MLKTVIFSPGETEYEQIRSLLPTVFPKEELVPEGIADEKAPYLCFYDDGHFIGFAEVLKKPELHYLKYMAMLPEYRSRGYGGKMLEQILSERGKIPLALDIEPLDPQAANYGQRIRRFHFYRKHGMKDSGYLLLFEGNAYSILTTGEPEVPEIMQHYFRDLHPGGQDGIRIVRKTEQNGNPQDPDQSKQNSKQI